METDEIQILVVDDEEDVVDMICRNLELGGFNCEGVTDPTEAVE